MKSEVQTGCHGQVSPSLRTSLSCSWLARMGRSVDPSESSESPESGLPGTGGGTMASDWLLWGDELGLLVGQWVRRTRRPVGRGVAGGGSAGASARAGGVRPRREPVSGRPDY